MQPVQTLHVNCISHPCGRKWAASNVSLMRYSCTCSKLFDVQQCNVRRTSPVLLYSTPEHVRTITMYLVVFQNTRVWTMKQKCWLKWFLRWLSVTMFSLVYEISIKASFNCCMFSLSSSLCHRLSNGVWKHYCIIFWLCQSHIFCGYFLVGSLHLLDTERILLSLWSQMHILYPVMFWNTCSMQSTTSLFVFSALL